MNHTTKTTTRLGIATATVAIATVALSLVTAALVNMIPVQIAHASCITSPKGDLACSGGVGPTCAQGAAQSCSRSNGGNNNAQSGPSGSLSTSLGATGEHRSFSHNFLGEGNCADTTCSGPK